MDKICPIFSQLGWTPRRWAELGVGEGQLEGAVQLPAGEGGSRCCLEVTRRALESGGEGPQCLPSALGIRTSLLQLSQQPWARVGPCAMHIRGNSGLSLIRRMPVLPSLGGRGSSRGAFSCSFIPLSTKQIKALELVCAQTPSLSSSLSIHFTSEESYFFSE